MAADKNALALYCLQITTLPQFDYLDPISVGHKQLVLKKIYVLDFSAKKISAELQPIEVRSQHLRPIHI